jgi:hypothetical protein
MRSILSVTALALGLSVGSVSNAATILTMTETPGALSYSQQPATHCVITGTTCPSQTVEVNNYVQGGVSSVNEYSPTYSLISGGASSSFNWAFNYFDMAVNSNITNTGTDTLNLFEVLVNGAVVYTYTGTAGNIATLDNGRNDSEYLFSGIDLTSYAPGSTVQFHAVMSALTDGSESLFAVNGEYRNPQCSVNCGTVPVPGSIALLSLGLLGLAGFKRRS